MKSLYLFLLLSVLVPVYAGTGNSSDAVWGVALVIGIILLFPGIAYASSWIKAIIHHKKDRQAEEWLEAE